MSESSYFIREIQPKDNPAVAQLIKEVMTEYGAIGEGYSINDEEVDKMFDFYNNEKSAFYVVEKDGKIWGCGGFSHLQGGHKGTCELKKMYFYPELRGKGFGRRLIYQCLNSAKKMGYQICYLETIASMKEANHLYQKIGFSRLSKKMGDTGHSACNTSYSIRL